MIKFITLLNLTGLLLFKALFITEVSVTQDTPATLQAGSEVKVTVTVDKDGITGFAKLQIDLPEGLTATAIETKGASFTFAEGKAKFIWMALPATPQFKVTYTLSAGANASGSLPINGKFSYIEENDRKTKDLPSTTVTITGGTPVVAETTNSEAGGQAANANDVAYAGISAPAKDMTPITAQDIAPMQGAGNVGGSRKVTLTTENEMLVEVVLNKGDIRGFGKLQETIPAGFTALEKSSSEAIFTAQDRIVKFVWLNLPAKSEIKVVYKLRSNDQPVADYTINGEFGYLLNDETQKAVIGSTNFKTGAAALQAQAAAEKAAQEALVAQTAQTSNTQGQQGSSSNANVPSNNKPDNGSANKSTESKGTVPANTTAAAQNTARKHGTSMPGAESGVNYKVQITAAHREVGAAYFAERHHYNGDFSIEHHEGWIKYVTGRFSAYAEARDQRQGYLAAGNNFPGPFVTAYNNGDRITVQEALMISNQKWIQ